MTAIDHLMIGVLELDESEIAMLFPLLAAHAITGMREINGEQFTRDYLAAAAGDQCSPALVNRFHWQ